MLKPTRIILGFLLASSAFVSADSPAVPVHALALELHTVGMPVQAVAAKGDTWLLHLPGISGRRRIDDEMSLGFRDGGFTGLLQIYDWTGQAAGLEALHAYKHNQAEAQKVADYITQRAHSEPGLRIILTGHSGGTGIAIWALEKLPDDVKVDTVILLASALSPDYDLSKALSHVRSHCFSFCSENDILVLGTGTKMFGTIDGKNTEAAGQGGFVFPKTGDARQYAKLIQKPYDKIWKKYDNLGDHMGCMFRPFAGKVIAPLLAPEPKPADVAHQQAPAAQQGNHSQAAGS